MDSGIERVEQIVEASSEAVRRHRRRRTPRRFLRGCAIGCGISLLVLLGVWWYVSRNLGDLISGVVKKQAAESLYGRLEFSKLKVDLAGRAVFSDLEVYADESTGLDTETPVLKSPRVSASLDFFTLFGPNRGKRAIALSVEDAELRVIREADGSFKLAKIFRKQTKKREPWGIAVTLKDAKVDFTDHCLLGKMDFKMAKEGLGARLLDELGYRVARDGDAVVDRSQFPAHHELAVLNGSIAINGEREEIGLKLEALRQDDGGLLSVEGLLADDGSTYDLSIGLRDTQLSSARDYAAEIFPRLLLTSTLEPASPQPPAAAAKPGAAAGPASKPRPELKLLIETLDLKLSKVPKEEVQSQITTRFKQLSYDSPLLGHLQLYDSGVDYTPDKLLALDLNLQALGARITGKPSLRWDEKDPTLIHLDGRINLKSDDFKTLRAGAAKLPLKKGAQLPQLSGSGEASLDLGGTTRAPELRFKASGEKLAYEKYKAGKLAASGSYSGPPGAPAVSFDLELNDGDIAGMVVGKLNAKGDYKGPPGSATGKATVSSSALSYGSIKLGKLNALVSIDKGVATLSKGSLTGGEVPLSASGKLNLKTKDGAVKASLGPLEFADLLALGDKAQQLKPGTKAKPVDKSKFKDVSGKVTASADALIVKGKFKGSLGLSSDKLTMAGNTFKQLVVKGGLENNSIRIDSAEATVTTKEAIDLAGFVSKGPLSLNARAGGTISLPPSVPAGKQPGPMVLALSGKASTNNLSPEQANISFKLTGPASGPELKLQLKTTAKTNPLALSAKLMLKEGLAPATASLSWYASKVDYDGKLDFKGQKIEGSLNASEVDLQRFTSGSAISGKLSAKAKVSGSFKAPDIAGHLDSQKISIDGGERSYDITALSAGFKLNTEARSGKDKNGKALGPKMTLAVSDGSFSFEGMPFTAKGVLGREGSELSLACPSFNLFSVLALVPDGSGKRPQITASGPLSIDFSGTPEAPKATISYSSGAGSVEGHKFSSASLSAKATKSRLDLSSLKVESADGSIEASGTATYILPEMSGAGGGGKPVTPKGGGGKSGESSDVIGKAAGSSPPAGKPAASTPAKQAQPPQTKTPKPAPDEDAKDDDAGDSTTVGWLGITAAHAQGAKKKSGFELTSFTAQATVDNFDIGVLTPLSGDTALSELSGRVSGAFSISGSAKEVNGSGDLKLTNGKFHGIAIEQATAKLKTNRLADGRLQMLIEDGRIVSAKTKLNASGKIGPEAFDSSFNVEAESLDLALLTPFIPEESPKLSGVLTGSLSLSPGKGAFPKMTISLRDNGNGVRIGENVKFTALAADARIENDLLTVQNLKISSQGSSLSAGGTLNPAMFSQGQSAGGKLPLDFWLKSDKFDFSDAVALAGPLITAEQLKLVPEGSISADIALKGTAKLPQLTGTASFNLTKLPGEMPLKISGLTGTIKFTQGNGFELQNVKLGTGSDPALSAALVTGSGELLFAAPWLKSGSIDVNLSPGGKFIPFDMKETFSGTIGGLVTITGKPVSAKAAKSIANDFQLEVGGNVIITGAGDKSTYTYNPPPRGTTQKVNRNLRLKNFEVLLNPGTQFRFTPPSAAQKLALSDMTASLKGSLKINGVPGVLDKNDPDAFSIKGDIDIPAGTLLIYKYKVKMDGLKNSLKFSGAPGDIYPEFSGRGKLTLPRVLKGYDAGISLPGSDSVPVGGTRPAGSGGRNDDLTIFFNFDRVKLEPGAGLGKFTLTSEPPMGADKIQGYLLGGVTDVLTGQTGLDEFAEGELIGFGSSFISRQIERSFDLESFNIGGSGSTDNPYFMDVEKAVSPNISLTYYRNFFSETAQEEEFGVRYKLFEEQFGNKYSGLQLNVDFNKSGLQRNGATVEVEYTIRFEEPGAAASMPPKSTRERRLHCCRKRTGSGAVTGAE